MKKPRRSDLHLQRSVAHHQDRLRRAKTPMGRYWAATQLLAATLTHASAEQVEQITQALLQTNRKIGANR